MSAETEQQYRADGKFNGVDEPRYTYRRRWRGKGSYRHSCPPDQADSFCVYIDKKNST